MSRFLRLATHVSLVAALAIVILSPQSGRANVTPADPPSCQNCPQREYYLNSFVSLTEGNVGDTYSVAQVRSAFGPTLDFQLVYNSYDADGSRNMWTGTGASIDTVMGYGWTHTYNDLLFTQHTGDMFRLGPDGRITRFALQNDGSYQTSPGYFETLVKNGDGSFDLTTKYQTDVMGQIARTMETIFSNLSFFTMRISFES